MGYIYKISNIIDERVYIGSTLNLHKRWNEHKRNLLNSRHQNIHLQNFVNKYGLSVLIFNILENVDDCNILIREQYYLDNTKNKFNIAKNSCAPMTGKSHTPEALKKISQNSAGSNNPMFGKKRPQWLINKLIVSNRNRQKTNEEKIKRMIKLPNRTEVMIKKENVEINCFSISHASKFIKTSQQSISKALKNNKCSNGWKINKSNNEFYDKSILLQNVNLFDKNCHPQPELIEMLKSLA